MPAFAYTVLDVFTAKPLTGNALAVVHDADGLDDATMLAFARETRLSETTFVQSAGEPGADYRNRIWMTTGELPFAGHPSLGTAVAVARRAGEVAARYVQQTGAGLQEVRVRLDGDIAHASMLQEPAELGAEVDPALALAAAALGAGDAHPELVPQVVSTGVPQLIVPVREEEVLDRARPDGVVLAALLAECGAVTLYLVALAEGGARASARSFFRDVAGPGEDPATGSAAGPLCAYLAARGLGTRVEIEQGARMGRPSRLLAEVAGDRVRVAGDAVAIADGTLRL